MRQNDQVRRPEDPEASASAGEVNAQLAAIVESSSPVDSLSARERQVLQLVVEGKTSNEIARMIFLLSPKSVQTYRSRLMMKLGVREVPSLVKFALEHGLTPPQ